MSDVNFSNLDAENVEREIITHYEQITDTTLYPGDPVRLFLEALAYALIVQNNLINLAGQQNLLSYASGSHLDHIGLMVGTSRLSQEFARATQEFELNEALDFDVIIPNGTRVVTADNSKVFKTDTELKIIAGLKFVYGTVTALEAGADKNALLIGQINTMFDPVAYIKKTRNINISSFGADIETDESYRLRIQQAPERYTNAGSTGAYRAHAIGAHQDIEDVSVYSPIPGTVDIRPILKGGILPNEEILELVHKAVNADYVRPLTDTVLVKAPETFEYDIKFSWSVEKNKSPLSATITKAVQVALEKYIAWQKAKPGRDINPTKLISMLEQAGARRVILEQPKFTKLEPKNIAKENLVEITFLGVDNE